MVRSCKSNKLTFFLLFIFSLINGMDTDEVDQQFLAASQIGDCEKLEKLLVHRPNVDIRDSNNCTPLHWAARCGYADCVKKLLTHGADMSALSDWGNTALHFAVKKNSLECVEILLRYGAPLEARDNYNRTPLDLATTFGYSTIENLIKGWLGCKNFLASLDIKYPSAWYPAWWGRKS